MSKQEEVIFLIDSNEYDRTLLSLSLEKLTNFKVFNFFSIDEAYLYLNLNPRVILYSDGEMLSKSQDWKGNIEFLNIKDKIYQEGKGHLIQNSNLALKIISLLQGSLN